MSKTDLATEIVDANDKIIRNAIDSMRQVIQIGGNSVPVLTDSEWDQTKPVYIAMMETLIENTSQKVLSGIINQVNELIDNKVAGLSSVLNILIGQITACMASTIAITPPIPGYPPTVAAQTVNTDFNSVKTKLDE